MPQPTIVDDLRRWLLGLDRDLVAIRRATVSDVPTRQPRFAAVSAQQKLVTERIEHLIRVYWQQPDPIRRTLLRDYLGALETAKLVTDDVFIESVYQARLAKRDDQLAEARRTYKATLITWTRGSPLLNLQTTAGNDAFIKEPGNFLGLPPGMRQLRNIGGDSFWTITPDGVTGFSTRVRQATQREIGAIRSDPARGSFTPETFHLLGLLFLRAQIELHSWAENDTVERQAVDDWYAAVARLVNEMREDVLDVLGLPVRQALVNGDTQLASRFAKVETQYLRSLARLYSVRDRETTVLFAYFARATAGQFASEAEAVGVNKTVETVSEYAGHPNPDRHNIGDLKTVDNLMATASNSIGQIVRVAGVFRAADSTLSSETGKPRVDVQLETPRFAPRFTDMHNRVIVEGTLAGQPSALVIRAASIEPWSISYVSKVGFPLRRDQPVRGTPLQLEPEWRSHTVALEAESLAELAEASLPGTLAGQQAAVAEIMRRPEIVRLFAFALSSSERKTLDLTDPVTRSKVWRTVFDKLVRTSQRTALNDFFPILQQYLTSYTRHTYLNMRDSGRNYLDSSWPTDITGGSFYDCGVYALEIARDIHAAVHSSPVEIEFRFMTFLNHVCLIGYVGNEVFLANNDTLHLPRLMTPAVGQPSRLNARAQAGLAWARRAFSTVYGVQYTVFPAVIPTFGVSTSLGESVFRRRLWSVFKQSIGWGLVAAGAAEYFAAISTFNRDSIALRAILKQPAGAQDLDKATAIATNLYELARILSGRRPPSRVGGAASSYLVLEHPFPPETFVTALGFSAPDPERLPMYDLVEMLQRRTDLTLSQRELKGNPVAEAHIEKLLKGFVEEVGRPR